MDFFDVAKHNFWVGFMMGFMKRITRSRIFLDLVCGGEDGNLFAHHRRYKGGAKLRNGCGLPKRRGVTIMTSVGRRRPFLRADRTPCALLCAVNDAQRCANEAVVKFDLVVRPRVLEAVNFIQLGVQCR